MKKRFLNMSFRNKILTVLLLNTIVLSGFSLTFVQSIEDIHLVSQQVKSESIPEVVWVSHWEEELRIKKYIVEYYLLSDSNAAFIETYTAQGIPKRQPKEQIPIPSSLEAFERKIKLLDFIVLNNVQGLLLNEDEEAAKAYIQEEYLPRLEEMKKELAAREKKTLSSLAKHTNSFSSIIEKSLLLLITLTLIVMVVCVYAAYRASSSLTEPIEKMIKNVNEIASGKYGLIINEINQIELQPLTESINRMSIRLNESFDTIVADKVYRDQILNSLPVGIITSDDKTSAMSINTSGKKLLKIGDQEVRWFAEKDLAQNKLFWDMLLSKRICENEKVQLELDGRRYQLLVSQSELLDQQKKVIGRIFYFLDITKTEEMESRMHQSEKLALVGELAAGAAHEIRNPLAVIQGFLSLMDQSISDSDKERFYLPLVMKEIERINAIIEEMLLLSKPEAPIMKKVLLEELVRDILPLITQAAKEKVEFDINLEPIPVYADPNQMKQVLHNLIRNGIEAISGRGTISLSSNIKNNTYRIYVQDTGRGMPDSMKRSLFYPFATSKADGTGLGLTIVQRIIESHEGTIQLLSTSGKGTVFRIDLPIKK